MPEHDHKKVDNTTCNKSVAPEQGAYDLAAPEIFNGMVNVRSIPFLQRTVGNRATQNLIQRLPSPTAVTSKHGEPKANVTIFGKVLKVNSSHYRAVLEALKVYNNFVLTTKVSLESVEALNNIYTRVEEAINAYLGRTLKKNERIEDDKRFAFIQSLRAEMMTERTQIGILAYRIHKNRSVEAPTWHIVLVQPGQVNIIADSQVVGSNAGGTNQVAKVNQFGREGYFKPNQEVVPLTGNMDALTGKKTCSTPISPT